MRLRNMTIGKKLWLSAFMSASVLIGINLFNNRIVHELTSKLNDVGRTQLPLIKSMILVDMMHDGLRAVVYRSLIAAYHNDKEELKSATAEYSEFKANITMHLMEIHNSNSDSETQKYVNEAILEVRNYVKSGEEVLDLLQNVSTEAAVEKLPAYQASFEALEKSLGNLGDRIESNVALRVQDSANTAEQAKIYEFVIGLSGVLFGLLVSYLINQDLVRTVRSLVQRLNAQGISLKSHSDQIESSSHNLNHESGQQASAVQRTASAMSQIGEMVAKTSDNSKILSQNSQASLDAVEQGQLAIQQMLTEIDAIRESNTIVMKQMESGNQQINGIVKVIREIGEKTKIIHDIVFQTKLLSFNASVEAARAGEHGKGFAVVAEEVGNLAQMSGNAAKEITEMLETGTKRVSEILEANTRQVEMLLSRNSAKIENGKSVAYKCGDSFSEIVNQVRTVYQLSADITTAIEEQKLGLDEIRQAIDLFSQSTQVNSATANETSLIAKQLQSSFIELQNLMSELNLLVDQSKNSVLIDPQLESASSSQEFSRNDLSHERQNAA